MKTILFLFSLILSPSVLANEKLVVTVNQLNKNFETQGIAAIGTITLEDTAEGLSFVVDLKNIPAGEHGFHVHENPECGFVQEDDKIVPGAQAGGHFDPKHTSTHLGPLHEGHLGDLPALLANEAELIQETVIAPRLKLKDIRNRSLMIHAGGDNYLDEPAPLGGGGARIACGVIN